jgi:hypothetical protein
MSTMWEPSESINFSATHQPSGRSLHLIVTGWEPSEQEPALVTVTLQLRLGPDVAAED